MKLLSYNEELQVEVDTSPQRKLSPWFTEAGGVVTFNGSRISAWEAEEAAETFFAAEENRREWFLRAVRLRGLCPEAATQLRNELIAKFGDFAA